MFCPYLPNPFLFCQTSVHHTAQKQKAVHCLKTGGPALKDTHAPIQPDSPRLFHWTWPCLLSLRRETRNLSSFLPQHRGMGALGSNLKAKCQEKTFQVARQSLSPTEHYYWHRVGKQENSAQKATSKHCFLGESLAACSKTLCAYIRAEGTPPRQSQTD